MFKPGDIIKSKFRNIEMDEGRHNRAKLGFILMSTDLAAESDFFDIIPEDVAIHITRLKTDDYTTNETLSILITPDALPKSKNTLESSSVEFIVKV